MAEPGQHRIVVTGMGAISPVGNSAPDSWASIRAGRGGITRITHFDASILPVHIAGEVKDFDPVARSVPRRLDGHAAHPLRDGGRPRGGRGCASRYRRLLTGGGGPHRVGHRRAGGSRAGNANARHTGRTPGLAVRGGDGTGRHGAGDGRDRSRRARPEHGDRERVRVGRGRDRPGRELDQAGRRGGGARRRHRGRDHLDRHRDVRRRSCPVHAQ